MSSLFSLYMQGDRYNKGKTKWSLVDWESLEPFVQVLMFGANKYTKHTPKPLEEIVGILNERLWENRQNVLSVVTIKTLSPEDFVTNAIQKKLIKKLNVLDVGNLEQLQALKGFVSLVMNEKGFLQEQKSQQDVLSTKNSTEAQKSFESERKNGKGEGLELLSLKKNKESEVEKDIYLSTEYQKNSMKHYYSVDVGSVGLKRDHILTMTITQESLEICYVVSATKLLDCYKIILTLLNLCTNTSVSINEILNTESGVGNWQKGLKVTETLESCLRHIFSFLSGEDNDKESGLTHLGHAMCNLHFATWMLKHRPDMDDRPKRKDTQLKLNLFDEPLTTSEKRCTEISSRDSSLH